MLFSEVPITNRKQAKKKIILREIKNKLTASLLRLRKVNAQREIYPIKVNALREIPSKRWAQSKRMTITMKENIKMNLKMMIKLTERDKQLRLTRSSIKWLRIHFRITWIHRLIVNSAIKTVKNAHNERKMSMNFQTLILFEGFKSFQENNEKIIRFLSNLKHNKHRKPESHQNKHPPPSNKSSKIFN